MSSPLTIKVILGQEIRRLSFGKPPSFQSLVQMVANLFNININKVKPLLYRDDENDIVTIGSDLELFEALRLAESNKQSLRLYLNKIEIGAETIEVKEPEASSPSENPAPTSAPLAAVRDAAILQVLAAHVETVLDKIQKAYNEGEIKKHFDAISAAASSHMNAASDTIRPYLVAVQTYVSSTELHPHLIQNLTRLTTSMQQQAERLVHTTHQRLGQYPFVQSAIANLETLPQQISDVQRELMIIQGDILAKLPPHLNEQLLALPGQIAALPSQLANYLPAPQPQCPVSSSAKSPSSLPSDAAQQDIHTLEAMGFTDRQRNVQLLLKHKGDIQAVVTELLSE